MPANKKLSSLKARREDGAEDEDEALIIRGVKLPRRLNSQIRQVCYAQVRL